MKQQLFSFVALCLFGVVARAQGTFVPTVQDGWQRTPSKQPLPVPAADLSMKIDTSKKSDRKNPSSSAVSRE